MNCDADEYTKKEQILRTFKGGVFGRPIHIAVWLGVHCKKKERITNLENICAKAKEEGFELYNCASQMWSYQTCTPDVHAVTASFSYVIHQEILICESYHRIGDL